VVSTAAAAVWWRPWAVGRHPASTAGDRYAALPIYKKHAITAGYYSVELLPYTYPPAYSIAKWGGCFQQRLFVCLSVCLSTR